jgi:hypothetical protein
MEAEATAHNRHGELVEYQLVFPYDKEVAIGEHGLTLEVISMGARKAGEKGISNRTLCAERLRQQKTRKTQEVKAYSRVSGHAVTTRPDFPSRCRRRAGRRA